MPKGNVRVMLSYDYCHFEFQLGSEEDACLEDMDNLRKEAMRLADKAIAQYKQAKQAAQDMLSEEQDRQTLTRLVEKIHLLPPDTWTPTQKAQVKALEDWHFMRRFDYQDNWEPEEYHRPDELRY